jgi:hypothetical protein
MANIPTYTSREKATTEAPAVYIKPAKYAEEQSPELAAKMSIGAGLEQAGNLVAKVADKMLQIQNANSESEANILVTQTMATHEDEVNKNPDLNNALKDTPNKIQEMKRQGASKFVDPRARAEWERNFDLKAIVYQNALKTNVLKRQIDLGRANTLREMDLESSNYINAPTPEVKLASRQKISNIMADAIKLQLFTEEQGIDEVNKVIKSADETTKDLESLRKRKEKEIELAAKEAKNARENELIQLRVNKTNSLEDLIIQARTDMNAGRIDPKFAEAYINSCKSPKVVGAKTNHNVFNNIAEKILDPTKKSEKSEDINNEMLRKNAVGELTDEDFHILHTFNQGITKETIDKAIPKKSFWQRLFNFGKDTGLREETKSQMFKEYMQRVISGENPEEVITDIIRKKTQEILVNKVPSMSNLPKGKGQLMIDGNGNKAIVYSDGTIEEAR